MPCSFPAPPEVLATLGWALYRAGRLDQAEQKLRAAVTGGRTTADIAYFLARVWPTRARPTTHASFFNPATEHDRGVRSPR